VHGIWEATARYVGNLGVSMLDSPTACLHARQVARPVTVEEVNSLLKEASQSYLKDILGFDEVPKVSTDYVDDSRSSIVDAACTQVGC
jgi:glyceraldehyde-3-phosphate dehydrogenase/erythrose-4-phosphate dehydrogenase